MARKMAAYGEREHTGRYALDDYTFSRNHTKAVTIRRWKRNLKKKARQKARRRASVYADQEEQSMSKEEAKIYSLMMEKLEAKKAELKSRREHFQIMVNNEIDTGCFEQNAINDLLYMKELRTEIAELEHWTRVIGTTQVQMKAVN